ncbi:MAG: hypothetical protein M1825_006351 [Sarcosagium campestre]|nr:MAG: hypothetical protein M1825_006351 [Sarcosagium campestre]
MTTLVLGSLFSILNPPAANYTFSTSITSSGRIPEPAPSYFARKSNIFNVLFVKLGWFWTTVAFSAYLLDRRLATSRRLRRRAQAPGATPSSTTSPSRITTTTTTTNPWSVLQAILRYALFTLYWIIVTRWCFGPALIDRSFTLTGGFCERHSGLLSAAACKAHGGRWNGGHDISGHVFLLVMSSAFLGMEVLPEVLRVLGAGDELSTSETTSVGARRAKAKTDDDEDEITRLQRATSSSESPGVSAGIGLKVVLGVTALSWWMLLMTAAYFHTWLEKLTGLVVALVGVFVVYYLPRGVPSLRAVIGAPES